MTPERWQQVKQIFESALEHKPAQRDSFLAAACAGDPSLREEVESLLLSHDRAGGFILSAALDPTASFVPNDQHDSQHDSMMGRRIGAYRLIRQIGHGGMGAVYLAARADEEFQKRVAIKLVKRGMDTDSILRRFRHERQILASLDHPNIARLLDGGTLEEGLPYFVMEYIEGKPIYEYCDTHKLSTVERLRLFRTVCSAVHYAHQNLVVHRDIKPGNILVTAEGVPKLLDFGIAKLLNPELSSQTIFPTAAALRAMTPEYASPEQVRGEPITIASDVYSLGVVLYELLTGHRPYRITSRFPQEVERVICEEEPAKPSTAVSRIEEVPSADGTSSITLTPESVSKTREGEPDKLRRRLTGDLDNIVLKAMRKEPQRRYESVEQFSEDIRRHLEGLPVMARKDTLGYRSAKFIKRHRREVIAATIIAVLLVGILVTAWWSFVRVDLRSPETSTRQETGSTAGATKSRRSVAVFGFKNLSGRPDAGWLSTAFSEMFKTELAAGQKLRMVPGEDVARLKIELSLADADNFARNTLSRIRKNLGTDLIVLGSYLAQGEPARGRIRLDLRLQDAETGDTVASLTDNGVEAELIDLVSRAGARLRESLGIGGLSEAEAAGVRATLPSNPEATRLYSEGLARLRVFDALGARDLLERAVTAEPTHALAHSALAAVWSTLGYDLKAQEAAKKALDLSAQQSREERLSIEGRYREMTREWQQAAEIYQTLFNFFPDNLDYGLRLASVQTTGGKGKEALATVEALRKLSPPVSEDPRIDLAEAQAAESLSDFKRAQAASGLAAAKGNAQGARLLVARARFSEGRAYYNLGQVKQAKAVFEEARRTFAEAGDRAGVAAALNNIAVSLGNEGDVSGSRRMHEEALVIRREIGDKKGMSGSLNNVAILLKDQGDLSGAQKMHEESLAIRRELGNKSDVALSLNNIGVVLFEQDRLAQAKKMYEESLAMSREIGEKRGMVRALHNLAIVLKDQGKLIDANKVHEQSLSIRRHIGDKRGVPLVLHHMGIVLFEQGDLAGAKKKCEEALGMERSFGHKRGMAFDLLLLGQILAAEGNLAAARKNHEEALAIRTELGEKRTVAEGQLALGELSIEEGHLSEAEGLVRKALDEFRKERGTAEARGHIGLAQVLLAQNKTRDAEKEIEQATVLAGKSETLRSRLSVAITSARVLGASGKSGEAVRSLEAVLVEATKTGLVPVQLEARLALGEVEMKSPGTAARGRLRALEKEARAKGFGLIARKAAAYLRS